MEENKNIEEVTSAQNDEVDTTTEKNERDWKKEYYKEYWTRKQIEKKISDLESKVSSINSQSDPIDYGNYNKDEVLFVEKLAEKKAEQIVERKLKSYMEDKHNQELVSKEQQAFLDNHPEAIEDLDRIKKLQKEYFPEKSYSYVYKKFFVESESKEPEKRGVKLTWWTWWIDVTKVNPSKRVSDQDLRDYYWKLLNK